MDIVGLLAAACVLATFCMQSMFALRVFAMISNVLFIIYGAGAQLMPIVLLHVLLLPINGWVLGRQYGGNMWGRNLGLTAACGSALLLSVTLGSDLARADHHAVTAIGSWFAHWIAVATSSST
jgi:hypothetical protein